MISTAFFGFVQGVGSRRGGSTAGGTGGYIGNSLAILIQRTTNELGEPTATGFTVYGTDFVNLNSSVNYTAGGWPAYIYGAIVQTFLYGFTPVARSDFMGFRIGNPSSSDIVNGKVEPQFIYYKTPNLKAIDNILSYKTSSLSEGSEISVELYPGETRNYIALGQGSGLHPDGRGEFGANFSIAMLWQ